VKNAAGGTAGALYQIAYKNRIAKNETENAMIVRDVMTPIEVSHFGDGNQPSGGSRARLLTDQYSTCIYSH
jgi:hypothetical protein